ncbi:MAG TPA: hypothetical protein DDY51_11895, partial [Erwinia persicina]|nr:hypothetical protein [Erwinia persicina]
MNKALYSFPLKPLVIALAAAQGFLSLANATPQQMSQTIDAIYASNIPLNITTETLFINNDGSIYTASDAVTNTQNTLLVDNMGTIVSQDSYALNNQSTIDTLRNSGTIRMGESGNAGVGKSAIINRNGATIGTLLNSGVISTGFSNDPMMSQTLSGISNAGTLGKLINDERGYISGSRAGILNSGLITELNNAGTITTTNNGFMNKATDAIINNRIIGSIINSGTIAGNIRNNTINVLSISGGSFQRGILTGSQNLMGMSFGSPFASPVGTILSNAADVRLQQGMLHLNDNVELGGNHTLSNNADVLITQPLTINGNYHQTEKAILNIGVTDATATTGTQLDTQYGRLSVSGNALIDAGSTVRLSNTGSSYGFASGQRYLVISAGTATYNENSLTYLAENFNGKVSARVIDNGNGNDLA